MKNRTSIMIALLALLMVSCGNIMHDLQQQVAISLPLMPQIEYTSPQQGAESVFLNNRIFIYFNKELDVTTIRDDSFHVEKVDAGMVAVQAAPVETYSGASRIVVLHLFDAGEPPAEIEFDPISEYRVTLQQEIEDLEGNTLKPGYEWSFRTGDQRDDGHPFIDLFSPANNSRVENNRPLIWGRFNEDVIPDPSRWSELFCVKHSGTGGQVPGSYSFSMKRNSFGVYERRIEFRPEQDLEKDSRYDVAVSGFLDLAGNEMEVPCTWSFRTGSVRVEREDPGNYYEGFGTFGNKPLGLYQGYLLRTNEALPLVGFIDYDNDMYSFFDRSVSGPFAAGRYVRIVNKGVNILDMGLRPVAKMIDGPRLGAPGKMEVYVDHVFGRFILPRPDYWSRMGSEAEILSPEIGDGTTVFQRHPNHGTEYQPGMWGGNCLMIISSSNFWGADYLYPFGMGTVVNSGTMSFWLKIDNPIATMDVKIHFGGSGNYLVILNGTITMYVDGNPVQQGNVSLYNTGKWHHVYLLWDRNAGLSGGLRLRLFIDGIERLSATDAWSEGALYLFFSISETPFTWAHINVDNPKVWKHVVSEDPSFEWNGGAGRENALHAIYGPDDSDPEYDYRPKLTGPEGGVGYYYLP